MQGWLDKEQAPRSWARRWAVLKATELQFTKAPDDAIVLARIPIGQIASVQVVPVRDGAPTRHTFVIQMIGGASHALAAPTEADRSAWIVAAQQSSVRPRDAPQVPPHSRRPPVPPKATTQERRVRALYAYKASNSEELSFDAGDEIVILGEEGEWIKGQLRGREGYVPKTYVEVVSVTVQTPTPPPGKPSPSAKSAPRTYSVYVDDDDNDSGGNGTRPLPPTFSLTASRTGPTQSHTPNHSNVHVVRYEKRKDAMTKDNFHIFVINVDHVLIYRRVTEFRHLWARMAEQASVSPPDPPIDKETILTNYTKLTSELDDWLNDVLSYPEWSASAAMREFLQENNKDIIYRKTAGDVAPSTAIRNDVGVREEKPAFKNSASRDGLRVGASLQSIDINIVRTVRISESLLDRHFEYEISVTRDGMAYTIYRRYAEWFALHEKLLAQFPQEAGVTPGSTRIIPYMPGKKMIGLNSLQVALSRMNAMREYFDSLLRLDRKISYCSYVIEYFARHSKDSDPQFLASIAAIDR